MHVCQAPGKIAGFCCQAPAKPRHGLAGAMDLAFQTLARLGGERKIPSIIVVGNYALRTGHGGTPPGES